MTTGTIETPALLTADDEAGSGFQWLLAAMVESHEVALDPDPHLHSGDETATAAELELRLSCF